jgi:hypothetical protein
MYDQAKVDRINELVKNIKESEAELEKILGGAPVRKTWSRRPKPEQEGNPA